MYQPRLQRRVRQYALVSRGAQAPEGISLDLKLRRTGTALTLVGILFLATACGGADTGGSSGAPTVSASAAETASAASETPSAAPTTAQSLYQTDGEYSTHLEPGQIVASTKGDYLQTKIAADDVSRQYNHALVAEEVLSSWSIDSIAEAQNFIADTIATEFFDTPLNGRGETQDQWWARNAGLFVPGSKMAEDVRAQLGVYDESYDSKSIVLEEPWQLKPEWEGYGYLYETGTPRITAMLLAPKRVFLDDNGGIAVEYDLRYKMPYGSGEKTGEMHVDGTVTYSALKDPEGAWKLNAWQNSTSSATTSGLN